MSDTSIKVLDNGPFIVSGDITLLDGQGASLPNKKPLALCRCGRSTNMPYCTGAHEGNFNSVVRSK